MSNKHPRKITATKLRVFLSVALVLIILGMAGCFYLAYSFLSGTAQTVSEAKAEAESSDARLQQLISLQSQLDKYKVSADKAQRIVAESQSYQYQNQIIDDLTQYAGQVGISIVSFTFQESGNSSTQGSSGAAATPAPAGGESQAAPASNGGAQESSGGDGNPPAVGGGTATAPVGPKSTQVTVQLGSVNYTNLLHFIHLIEQNLTRMQVANLNLSGGSEGEDASEQSLNIEVYVR